MTETTQPQTAGPVPAESLQDSPATDIGVASLAAEKIRARYPDAILGTYTHRGETTLTIRSQDLLNVARLLRDDPELSFRHLANVTSVDWSKYPGYSCPRALHGLCTNCFRRSPGAG